jgi:hemerythrin-like metal-binding protein
MPNRVSWEPIFSLGNPTLDAQHQAILAQTHALVDCIAEGSADSNQKFDSAFQALMATAAEHFAAEEAQLTLCAYPAMEEHHNERDEFNFLTNEIITTENFERAELQRFLSLWWVGHIVGSATKYRAALATLPSV